MPRGLLHWIINTHVVAACIVGLIHFVLWRRNGASLPRYIHFLAFCALLVGFWLNAGITPDAPIARWGVFGQVFVILICPAMVYGFFILHGGAAAAARRNGLK
jgi:hypothetical protein